MIDLSILEQKYPTLFYFDKFAFFLRKYFPKNEVDTEILYKYLIILAPNISDILSYDDMIGILEATIDSISVYQENYLDMDSFDVLKVIVPETLLYSEIEHLYPKLYNSIKINYVTDRTAILNSLVGSTAITNTLFHDIAYYWLNNLLKFEMFKFK